MHSDIYATNWAARSVKVILRGTFLLWGLLRMRTEMLHAQARNCKRLASESLDDFVREALIELASDYEHLAERMKQRRQNLN